MLLIRSTQECAASVNIFLGIYGQADFMDPMIENGAKSIWSNVKTLTLFGSPKLSAGNYFQKFLKNIPLRLLEKYFLPEKLDLNTQVWSIPQNFEVSARI